MSEIKPCPELVEAKAEIVYQAKLLIKIRRKLALFVHDIEDEGDRVYFGSTNDADDLRTLYAEVDEFEWSRMEKNTKGRDLYQEMRNLNDTISKLGTEIGTIAADRDRASDACASVQKERDDLREMLEKAKVALAAGAHLLHKHCPDHHWLPEHEARIAEINAFLARYEGGRK